MLSGPETFDYLNKPERYDRGHTHYFNAPRAGILAQVKDPVHHDESSCVLMCVWAHFNPLSIKLFLKSIKAIYILTIMHIYYFSINLKIEKIILMLHYWKWKTNIVRDRIKFE